MAGWQLSQFQFISTLIGSGLTIFLLNSLSADIDQPLINFNIISDNIQNNISPYSHILSHTNNESNKKDNISVNPISNTIAKIDTVIANNGRTSATNVILGLYYPNGNITNFYPGIQSENITIMKQSPNLIFAKANRLSKDSIIAITTIVQCNSNSNLNYVSKQPYLNSTMDLGNITNLKCPPVNYFVTASYDQGSNFRTNINSNFINMDKFYSFHFRDQILTIMMTFAIISFIIALSYKRLRRFKKRISRPKFVFEIVKEIITIREVFNENIKSKKIFPTDLWFSKDTEEKVKIFNDYSDYNYLDDFYLKLKERADLMSRKNQSSTIKITKSSIDQENNNQEYKTFEKAENERYNKKDDVIDVKKINEMCLNLANNAVTNINWKNYQDLEDKKYFKPISIAVIIICAFLMSSVFEIYRITLFHYTMDLPSIYYRITYIFLTTIIRSFIFFIVAREIINFQTLFAYEVGTSNNILSFFIFDRGSQVKLLLFSFIIGGIPIKSLLTDFQFISLEIQSFTFDPSSGYMLFLIGLLIDISLFLALVLIIPKFIMKTKTVKV